MVYSTSSRYRVRDFCVNDLSMSQILYCILLHYINTHTRKKIKIKYLHMRIEEVFKQAMNKTEGKSYTVVLVNSKAAMQWVVA